MLLENGSEGSNGGFAENRVAKTYFAAAISSTIDLGGGARIWRGQNRTPYHEKIGARFDRFGRSCGAGLIVALCAPVFVFRSDAGSDDQKIAATGFADGARFLHGSDDAVRRQRFLRVSRV